MTTVTVVSLKRSTAPEPLRTQFACYVRRGEVPHWVRHYCRFEPVPVTTPVRFQASPARWLTVGAYFVFSLLPACALFVFY